MAGPNATGSTSRARSICSNSDRDQAARPCRHRQGRDRRRRHRFDDRHRHAQPRRAVDRADGAAPRRTAAADLWAGLRRRRASASPARRARRWRRRARPCCFWLSSCALCRFAATTGRRATSSPPRCSATAPPARCCRPRVLGRRSSRAASTPGPAASTSWVGTSPMTASERFSRATSRSSSPTELRAVADEFLARHGLALDDIDRFVCHPGGTKVVTALEQAFGLRQGALAGARRVLRDYGNMSAATVLFVLEQMLAEAPQLEPRVDERRSAPGSPPGLCCSTTGDAALLDARLCRIAAARRTRLGRPQHRPAAAARRDRGRRRRLSAILSRCMPAGSRAWHCWCRPRPRRPGRCSAFFALLQPGRLWVILSLGRYLDDADLSPARGTARPRRPVPLAAPPELPDRDRPRSRSCRSPLARLRSPSHSPRSTWR